MGTPGSACSHLGRRNRVEGDVFRIDKWVNLGCKEGGDKKRSLPKILAGLQQLFEAKPAKSLDFYETAVFIY